jgi:hypothetical protein
MLAALRRGVRFRIAFAMAAFAVFAFVAPAIAVAFAPAERAAHCLTHSDHAIGNEHVDQAADHDHHPGGLDQAKHSHRGDKHPSQCCGLFCVTALAPEIRQLANPPLEGSQLSSLVVSSFHRRLPELPFRPPISLLSF